jgi:hypothetical protein
MTLLYPVAETPEQAIHAPKGFAAREKEARDLAAGAVIHVMEAMGPAFETAEAALSAFPSLAAQPWAALRPVAAGKPPPPAKPVNADGRRWPAPRSEGETLWRFSVAYWRIEGAVSAPEEAARKLRRDPEAQGLDVQALRALARQPLRPSRPQRALDIGLFEVRPPDAPHIVMPDE